MTTNEPSSLRQAMDAVDAKYGAPTMPQARSLEERKATYVEKIKNKPTERLNAYARGADRLIDDAREELVSMEAEHALIIEDLANVHQAKINAKKKELDDFQQNVDRCKQELAQIEAAGTEAVEKAVTEYHRQRDAQQSIIRAHQALRDAVTPAISDETIKSITETK